MRFLLCALLCAAVTPAAELGAPEIMQKSCERESRGLELRRQYTWRQHNQVRQRNNSGSYRQREDKVFDVFYIDGTEYRRLIEKEGEPLPERDAREEQAKLDRALEKHKHESESDRRKRQDKVRKGLEEERRIRAEIPKAYDFQLLGNDVVDGRACWKIRAEPKPGYKPPFREAQWLPKMHGTLWVDKQNYEWAKIDAETLDSFVVGLGLFRIGKGARVLLDQQFVNNEIWAPARVNVNANARALFLIGGNFDIDISFHDYRKYNVSSTVTLSADQNP